MFADLFQIRGWVIPLLQGFSQLHGCRGIQLVLPAGGSNSLVRSHCAHKSSFSHLLDGNRQQVRRILRTLQDFIKGGDVVVIRVISLFELLVQEPRYPVVQLEVMGKLRHLWLYIVQVLLLILSGFLLRKLRCQVRVRHEQKCSLPVEGARNSWWSG